ncbi:hypothetical protein DSO57_1004845 [Entomophthora muscae]|uniref:Uncharacterized protein n=1 Tax=Entomophthora muscae TaxID=34485 RepID=A0ACC2SAA6_9FUNG|nr:hypothetical protein DSO57_1004845 [Entomophthora muscae]
MVYKPNIDLRDSNMAIIMQPQAEFKGLSDNTDMLSEAQAEHQFDAEESQFDWVLSLTFDAFLKDIPDLQFLGLKRS